MLHLCCANCFLVLISAAAGTNKAASSSTSLNTRKLDDENENLARECIYCFFCILRVNLSFVWLFIIVFVI